MVQNTELSSASPRCGITEGGGFGLWLISIIGSRAKYHLSCTPTAQISSPP